MNDWYKITAKKGSGKAVIQIYGHIGESFWDEDSVSAKKFFKEVRGLDVTEIELRINSGGGSVFDGYAIYNILEQHPATVNVWVDALAASIASVIAMAGETVNMPENAMMMIHDPGGVVMGTAADMRKMAGALDKVKEGMILSYQAKSGMDGQELDDMLSEETWLTAQEAVDLGFADNVIGKVKVEDAVASYDDKMVGAMQKFKKVPPHIFTAMVINSKSNKSQTKEIQPMEITATFLKTEHPEIVAALVAEAITAESLKANHPNIVTALVEDLVATAITDAAEIERARIQGVLKQTLPGHEDLVNTLAFDGITTPDAAAVQVLAAEKKIVAGRGDALNNSRVDALPHARLGDPVPVDPVDDSLPVDEQAKTAWDKDGSLRGEFDGDYDQYLAWFRADKQGRAKVLSHRDKK